jgi:two-component system, NarL family, sensor kinase
MVIFFSKVLRISLKNTYLLILKITILFLLLGIKISVFSQNPIQEKIKLLESSLNGKKDTNQVILLNDLTWFNRTVSQDKAIEYGLKALKLSSELKFEKGEAQAYNDLGIIYSDQKKYDLAIESYNKALQIRKKIKDLKGIAALNIKLGIVYQEEGNFKEAVQFQLKALEAYEKLQFDYGIGTALNNLGVLFFDIGNYAESLKYHERAIEIRKKIKDNPGIAAGYSNIANIFLNEGNLDKAHENYSIALTILESENDPYSLAVALNNMTTVKTKKLKYSEALQYGIRGYELRKKIGDIKGLASSAANVGYVYSLIGLNAKALELYKEAELLSQKVGAKPERENVYKNLWLLYEKLGEFKNSLYYAKKYTLLKDTILNEANNKIINELSTKYQTEKKESENKFLANENKIKSLELKKNKIQLQSILILSFLLITLLILYFNFRRLKQQKKISEERLLFEQNRIKSILIAQEEERKRISEELHDGVGQMMSAVKLNVASLEIEDKQQQEHFESTLKLIDESCQEIRNISHAMMPGALSKLGLTAALNDLIHSFSKGINLKISYISKLNKERLDPLIEVNIYRICQELLQNTIKYANAKSISITIGTIDNYLMFEYSDDGKGIEIQNLENNFGNGWGNINSRINIMNGKLFLDSKVNSGLSVKIEIPQ